MGLFDFWKSTTDKRAQEVRQGTVAPTRAERRRCWDARDRYYACLDGHGIVNALKDDREAAQRCGGESAALDRDCATEWVTYFKKWRVANHDKQKRLQELQTQGATQVQLVTGPSGTAPGR